MRRRRSRDTQGAHDERAQRLSWHGGVRLGLMVLSLLVVGAPPSVAAQQRPTPQVLSLEDAVSLAVKNSPQIKEQQFGVLKRQSQRAQADAARFAQFFFQAEDGIRDLIVTGVQTCALPI